MVKTTGAEFWAFYNDKTFWPEGAWHDDTLILVNGKDVEDYTRENIPDDAQLEIDGGVVYLDERGAEDTGFESFFKKWRKTQNTVFLAIECPRDKIELVKAAIKAAGGKAK